MIINPCRLDPRGPCREDAGTCSAPRSADVTAQASAGWGHFARTGSPPPKPAFLPLRSTSCIAASAEPTASDTSVQFPCPGAGCSRLSRGLPVRFGFPLEVSAAPLWQGLKLKRDSVGNVTAVTHWEAKGVVASGLFQPQGSWGGQTTQSTHSPAPWQGNGLPPGPSLTQLPIAQLIYLHWANCLSAKGVTWTSSPLLPEAMKNVRRLVGNFRSSSSFLKLEIKFPLMISAEESSHLIQLLQ